MQVAQLAPDRVSALVLAAPPLPGWEWSPTMIDFWTEEDAALERDELDAAVEANVAMWAGADPAVRSAVRLMQRRAFELQHGGTAQERAEPASIGASTLVVVGSRDLPDFVHIAEHLAATMPAARKLTIEGAGHLVAMERPAEFAALVADFVGFVGFAA